MASILQETLGWYAPNCYHLSIGLCPRYQTLAKAHPKVGSPFLLSLHSTVRQGFSKYVKYYSEGGGGREAIRKAARCGIGLRAL